MPQQAIPDLINNTGKRKLSEIGQTFKPLLCNSWNIQKGNETDHSTVNIY